MLARPLILLLLAGACGGRSRVVDTAPVPPNTTWLAAPAPVEVPALPPLVAAVDAYVTSSDDATHEKLAAALTAMADVVRGLAPSQRAGEIEAAAQRLTQPSPAPSHIDSLLDALDEALAAVQDRLADGAAAGAHDAFVAAVAARERLSRDRPLLEQTPEIHLALTSTTNALAGAHGARLPFETTVVKEHRPDPEVFARQVSAAVTGVETLARTRAWGDARVRTAKVLESFAAALDVMPGVRAGVAANAATIRFHAMRLARSPTIDQRGVDWAKAGLLIAVDALEAAAVDGPPVLGTVIADARTSVAAIDANNTFPFSRPELQDAVRAVAAAYRVNAVLVQRTASRASR